MAKAWPFEPAWPPGGQNIQETYRFLTEVVTSRSGREFRLARRSTPRQEIRQSVLFDGENLRRYKDFMSAWHHRDVVISDIFREVSLPNELVAGSDTLAMADPPGWLVAGVTVVVGRNEHREALTVAGVSFGSVVFSEPASRTWPVGTPFCPGLVGNLTPQIEAGRVTNYHALGDVLFEVRPLSEVPRYPAPPERMFDGREVLTARPNWAEPVSSSLSHEVDILDYDTGPISRYAAIDFGREITGATYLGVDREQTSRLLDVFLRMKGRQGELWMPTWEPDFLLRAGGSLGSASLRIRGDRVADTHTGSTTHQAVFVYLRNGTLLLAKVLSLSVVDDATGRDTALTLESGWSQSFSLGDVAVSGWLMLRRFASDSLTVEWLTDSVANVQFNLTTLEALPDEAPPA